MSGELMLAEMAEQPAVLARLVARWDDVKRQVAAQLPRELAGVTFVARGSSDNAAVLGRYLVEMAARRPASLAAPSILTRYTAPVDYRGWLAIDPKGVIGEPPYEFGAALRNLSSTSVVDRWSRVIAERLGLDRQRIVSWAFAQAVLAAIWSIEDGQNPAWAIAAAESISAGLARARLQ